MAHAYQAVGWNRQKRRYDAVVLGAVALYLVLFAAVTLAARPAITVETLLIRAFGSLALLLMTAILAIGPLARLDRRVLPLLYNRRHLGVVMAVCALAHAALALVQFHALGDLPPLASLLAADGDWTDPARLPFQTLGFLALLIVLLMAATSHDFWLAVLGPRTWKALHMLVYAAFALVLAHVSFGALQGAAQPALAVFVGAAAATLVALHLAAGLRERAADRPVAGEHDGFVDVCGVEEIAEGRARIVTLGGERVAVFRHGGRVSAVSNVCRHQGGPLGEGRILDGCITCPWHGYQYRPEDGRSPPPFTDRIETYRVRVCDGRVLVHPRANPPGTHVPPAAL